MVDHTEFIDDVVHEETQTTRQGLDLTVADVFDIVEPGALDFGGDEYEAAEVTPHCSEKRSPEDDYEWWVLEPGQYLIEYNESLDTGDRFMIQPSAGLLESGAVHPSLTVKELPRVPLTVGDAGLELKENARVSTLIIR